MAASVSLMYQLELPLQIQSNQGKDKKWLLRTGDPLIQVDVHFLFGSRDPERWLLKTGDPISRFDCE